MDWNTRKGSGAMMPYKILVVDDEDNIRTLVQTMLKQDGEAPGCRSTPNIAGPVNSPR